MQQLTLPGIECVPGKMRRHGLREFHTYPLVSPGKDAAGLENKESQESDYSRSTRTYIYQ